MQQLQPRLSGYLSGWPNAQRNRNTLHNPFPQRNRAKFLGDVDPGSVVD